MVPCRFLILLNSLDQFPVDPAIAPVNATGHQMVMLCRSICVEERAQILDPLMGSKYLTTYFIVSIVFLSSLHFLVHRIRCRSPAFGTALSGRLVADTSDTSADESEASHPRRRVGSKRTFKMKKVWGADEVGRLFVTGAKDAASEPSHPFCRICRKDVSVFTHGPHEILKHFEDVKHFARDQRLRLETPGWRVPDFEGNPLSASELERRKEFILRGPLVIRDREYPFAEDLIVDDSVAPDVTLPVLAKVSSLTEALRLGGPYELAHQLWSQFTLIAGRVNIDVAWSCDEMLAGNFFFHLSAYLCALVYWCCVLVNHFERVVPSHPFSCVQLAEGTWPEQH